MKQLLALEAVAICLHSALVGNVATRKEASDIDTQASKELGVKHAVQIVSNVFQAIGFHIAIFYLSKRLSIHSISNRGSPGMISDILVRYPNMISCSLLILKLQ